MLEDSQFSQIAEASCCTQPSGGELSWPSVGAQACGLRRRGSQGVKGEPGVKEEPCTPQEADPDISLD